MIDFRRELRGKDRTHRTPCFDARAEAAEVQRKRQVFSKTTSAVSTGTANANSCPEFEPFS